MMAYNGMYFHQNTTRRVKSLHLSPETILDAVFSLGAELPQVLCVLRLEGVPVDAKVLSVHFDPLARAFAFLIEHESFEEVAFGERAPSIYLVQVAIRTNRYIKEDAVVTPNAIRESCS